MAEQLRLFEPTPTAKPRAKPRKKASASRKKPSPCPHHGLQECCNECPGAAGTDGQGFPHRSWTKGKKPLQRCAHCQKLTEKKAWLHLPEVTFFGCAVCAKAQGVLR